MMIKTADAMNTYTHLSCLGNAAGRKWGHILSKALIRTSRSFFEKIHFNHGLKGLDLFCGSGEMTLELSQVFGPKKCCIRGFDADVTSVEMAKENMASPNDQVEFFSLESDNWVELEDYDFVYCRSFLNQQYAPLVLFQKMYACLRRDGFILLEHLDLSNLQCFPQNYAFDRYLELHKALNKVKGTRIDSATQFNNLIQKAQFKNIRIQQISPTFLPENCKQIASLALESIMAELLEKKLTSQTEVQALLSELKIFEKQKNTMVSLPSIYQAVAYK